MAMFGSSWFEDEDEDGSMFGPKIGSWWVSSDIDPRWNKSGRGYGLVSSGGPDDAHNWIAECEENYGKRPEDLTLGFMKD